MPALTVNLDRASSRNERSGFHLRAQLLGRDDTIVEGGVGEHDADLLAAPARHPIASTDEPRQQATQARQRGVSATCSRCA
jgi:hypothetical protein